MKVLIGVFTALTVAAQITSCIALCEWFKTSTDLMFLWGLGSQCIACLAWLLIDKALIPMSQKVKE